MGFENVASEVNDFAEDVLEGIKDVIMDVQEFSKDAVESLGKEGMEALENGDIKGAIECSDMSEDHKEITNEIVEKFDVPNMKHVLMGGAKAAGGTLGAIAALATPGFQPAGLAAAATAFEGIRELASAIPTKQVNAAQANA